MEAILVILLFCVFIGLPPATISWMAIQPTVYDTPKFLHLFFCAITSSFLALALLFAVGFPLISIGIIEDGRDTFIVSGLVSWCIVHSSVLKWAFRKMTPPFSTRFLLGTSLFSGVPFVAVMSFLAQQI